MNTQQQAAYRQPDKTVVLNDNKEPTCKRLVAILCALAILLLMLNIGLIVYVLKNKNGDLNINDAYTTYATIHDAIEEQDLAFDDLVILAQVYKDQGLLADFEMQDDHIVMEAADGVTFIFTAEDMQTQTDSNLIFAVVNPAEESKQKEDLSFFDKLTQGRFIRLDGHIIFTLRFGPILRTNLRVADKSNWKQYAKAIRNREMIVGRDYFYICPSFFRNHLQVNALRGSVLFLRNDLCVRDNRLLNALFDKGLGMVVVMDQAMEEEQQNELSDLFMQQLAVQDADGSYRSAQACVTTVLDQFSTAHPDFTGQATAVQLYFPDGADDFSLTASENAQTSTTAQATEAELATEPTQPAEPETTITPAIMPEEAVEIYLNSYSLWEIDEYGYSGNYSYYGFLDLDFDGVLELVATINAGTGMYSTNEYYKIDLTSETVKKIENKEAQNEGGFDLKSNTVLYRNNTDEKLTYYSGDGISAGAYGGGTDYGPLWYDGGAVYSERTLGVYKTRENPSDSLVQSYSLNDEDISEEEYNALIENFEKENTNLNLQWDPCKCGEFDSATSAERKELLLNAYHSFCYDGFSFDSIYNPVPKNNAANPLTLELAENIVIRAKATIRKWVSGVDSDYGLNYSRPIISVNDKYYSQMAYTKEEMKADICQYMHESFFEEIFENFYIEQDGKLYYGSTGFGVETTTTVVRSDLEQQADSYLLTMHAISFNGVTGTENAEELEDHELTFFRQNGNWVIDDIGEGSYWFGYYIDFLSDISATMPETLTTPQEAFLDSFGDEDGMSVNMRSGPGTDNSIIKKIPDNAKLYVCGTSEAYPDWVFVCYLGDFGWVIKSCVFTDDVLTEGNILYRFNAANSLMYLWLDRGDVDSYNNITRSVNGKTYTRVYRYMTDLHAEFAKFFSEELYKKEIEALYKTFDGELYAINDFKQSNYVSSKNAVLKITSQSENECTFTVTIYFTNTSASPQTNTYKLKKINGNWVFVEKFEYINTTYNFSN